MALDCRLTLVNETPITAAAFLTALADRSDRVTGDQRGFLVDGRMHLAPIAALDSACEVRKTDERGLFHVFTAFFQDYRGPDAAIIVTPVEPEQFRTIIIVNDEGQQLGAGEAMMVLHQTELLAAEATFVAAWPNITAEDDSEDDDEAEGETVETGLGRDALITAGLLGDADTPRDVVSWLVFGASVDTVMRDLVGAPQYVAYDEGYLSFEEEDLEVSIEAVSFETDAGPAVELRIPLPMRQITETNIRLGARNAQRLRAKLVYVVEVDPGSEEFLVQNVLPDGHLEEPYQVRLKFD